MERRGLPRQETAAALAALDRELDILPLDDASAVRAALALGREALETSA
jgi:hypothetical protein